MDTLKVQLKPKPPKKAVETPQKTPEKAEPKAQEKPAKKSYLPENRKEDRDRFGEVVVTTYQHDYDGEGSTFHQEKIDEKRYSVSMKLTRKSEQGKTD
jgi:hypothetical protein